MNSIQPIKTIVSDALYNNYPLSPYFANSISCQPYLCMKASSLKELLLQDPDLQFSELDENFFNLYCFEPNFILKKNTIYYIDSESITYFNLEEIPYSDIIVSSILYLVKKYDLDCWKTVSEFFLESSFEDKLSLYFKKENLFIQYKKLFIVGFIDTFKEIEFIITTKIKNILKKEF